MIIIQLLKDTKYPANYQIIIDSSLGNYAVLRDFFSALRTDRGRPCPREWKDPQAKRCGRMERSGSLCGRGYRSAGCRRAEAAAREMLQRKLLRQHREATASGSADAKGYREAAAGREAFPSREGTRQHREETPSREEAKMSMGSAQRASA